MIRIADVVVTLKRFNLKTRLVIALSAMALAQALLMGGFAWQMLSRSLDTEIAQRALNAARTVAAMPSVIQGIETRNIEELNALALRMTEVNEALFVVIGDRAALRLAHPNPKKLGKSMADDEGDKADSVLIQGNAYVNRAKGSLGPSMRARAPVYDEANEEIIGVVSVGYALTDIYAQIHRYQFIQIGVFLIGLLGAFALAILIATRVKKEIFGLEPEQIARLFEERVATLASVREGIIAVNRDGIITTLNEAAIATLNLPKDHPLVGKNIKQVLPESNLMSIINHGEPQFDQEVWLAGRQMIVNRLPVTLNGEIVGAVSSFRPRDELAEVSQRLTRIEQYADSLRAQAHEYSNKLHTIAGLIQLDAKDEALKLIGNETHDHQALLTLLQEQIPDPIIAGCLLGKFNRAKEMGLQLQIDDNSSLAATPSSLTSDQLVSLLGNVLDNALEATRQHYGPGGVVSLNLTDLGHDVIIEVEDQGPGIPEGDRLRVFEKGISTKDGDHQGLGLHLVQSIVTQADGDIQIEPSDIGGTRLIIYLPKKAPHHDA